LPQFQINSNSENNKDAGSPPLTPRSPPHSPGNNHSDCGSNSYVGSNIRRASDLFMAVSVSAEVNKMKITELAVAAMEELTKMALGGEPLWRLQEDGKTEILNDVEYMREFRHVDATLMEIMKMVEVGNSQCLPSLDSNSESELESEYKPLPQELGPDPLHTEASRETSHVRISPVNLVELLMDLVGFSFPFS
jgi:homeobox-leucine zipper protein